MLNLVGAGPTIRHALTRAGAPDYFGWLDHVRAAAGCTRPIRLAGTIDTVNPATGQRLARTPTADLPDGSIYKACGTRLASLCPSCARTYQNDAYQILRAFLTGGKGVPDTVAGHPAIFPTLTAPSFGLVHTRVVTKHTCRNRSRCDCRPDPCRARSHGHTGLCQHEQPTVCFARHDPDDPRTGRPLCLNCYDHDHQVVWNLYAPELWRRTKQAAERHLTHLAKQRGIPPVQLVDRNGKVRKVQPVRLGHGKTAEMQRRAVIHYHALLRLDGVDPTDPTSPAPPPAGFTSLDLEDAIRHAATTVAVTTPPHPDNPNGWRITWGEQLDVQHIVIDAATDITDTLTDRYVTDRMSAGYLAKYATKSTEITGHHFTRLGHDTIDQHADPDGDHIARLLHACWRLGRPLTTPQPLSTRPHRPRPTRRLRSPWACTTCGTRTRLTHCPTCQPSPQPQPADHTAGGSPYSGLRRWAHRYGFGGHFLTKARRGCPTFGLLRAARVTHRRAEHHDQADTHGVIRTAEHTDTETTLIVGTLTFAGVGWHNTGDALLANTSAALARSRQQTAREEIAHEIGTQNTSRPNAA